MRPKFVDHLVFRVLALDRTERFYNALLGQEPDRSENSLMYIVGDTRLFFTTVKDRRKSTYDKENIGLNHLAFGVRSLRELQEIQAQLDVFGISNSGVKLDHYGMKEFIWPDDPDGQRIEFHLRPEEGGPSRSSGAL